MAQGLGLRTLVALTAAGAALPAHAEEVDAGPLSPPSVLDCAYDAEWDAFRRALQRNVAEGFRSENGVFQMADALISRHLLTFLAFHRSKDPHPSNEFFHDCNRDTPQGLVCLYGMLCAFFIHHIYLRAKIEGPEASADESEREVFVQSTNTARRVWPSPGRLADFFDSSGWPFTLAKIAGVLAPPEEGAVPPGVALRWVLVGVVQATGLDPPDLPERAPEALQSGASPVRPLVAAAEMAAAAEGRPDGHRRRPPADVEAEPGHGRAGRWLPPPGASPRAGARIVAYVTGTHSALAKESADMLGRFAGGLLGYDIVPVVEVADDYHCSFMDCDGGGGAGEALLGEGAAARGPARGPVGLRELGARHFRPRWKGLETSRTCPASSRSSGPAWRRTRSAARRSSSCARRRPCSAACSWASEGRCWATSGSRCCSPCARRDRSAWWLTFERMVSDRRNFFACYNPFLASMVEYQTGFVLPTIRLHGLYTEATYSPSGGNRVLVVKGPNICVDSVCLLNRFTSGKSRPPPEECEGPRPCFLGLDELGGLPYRELAAFRAVVMYPYDVALAMFYDGARGFDGRAHLIAPRRPLALLRLPGTPQPRGVPPRPGGQRPQRQPGAGALRPRARRPGVVLGGGAVGRVHGLRALPAPAALSDRGGAAVRAGAGSDRLAGRLRRDEALQRGSALVRSAGQWASGVSAALAGAAGAERRAWAQKAARRLAMTAGGARKAR
ncbi:unnamed protein product [Prorocentrum cordatum]|uniref:Uncharacterized protein n=1 Tax=Prorocentrum cordatum TaxID=2364126 RepID=A0ABN9QL26_9DINO|nr:unnamed protein product [Polarella glacialis]